MNRRNNKINGLFLGKPSASIEAWIKEHYVPLSEPNRALKSEIFTSQRLLKRSQDPK